MTARRSELSHLLPSALPECGNDRLLLYGFRRVAAHGLGDALAASAMLGGFGLSYRRPLVLLRSLAAELSRVSDRRLMIAPCCCARMTAAETAMIEAIGLSRPEPEAAHAALAKLLGVRECIGALVSAQALSQAFEDLGRPLG